MENIREIIATNLIALRKESKLTQLQFGEKINYSDKAVSRWEKGEVLPDIETLQTICDLYGVPLTYIFEKHDKIELPSNNSEIRRNKLALAMLSISVVWFICTVTFVYCKILNDYNYWQIFVWGVPSSCLVGQFFNHYYGKKKYTIYLMSLFIWSLLASCYLQLISHNLWLIFVIGAPIQACIILAYYVKR